jgi:hypothetical protein
VSRLAQKRFICGSCDSQQQRAVHGRRLLELPLSLLLVVHGPVVVAKIMNSRPAGLIDFVVRRRSSTEVCHRLLVHSFFVEMTFESDCGQYVVSRYDSELQCWLPPPTSVVPKTTTKGNVFGPAAKWGVGKKSIRHDRYYVLDRCQHKQLRLDFSRRAFLEKSF